jgi:hypothetical protein
MSDSEIHEYYLVDDDQLESIKNPPFIDYNKTYEAIVKSKEEIEQQEPKIQIKRWIKFKW